MTWTPWRFFLVAIAGWMNRQQQEAIAYLRTENRILREKLGQKRILLNMSQKRRLPRLNAATFGQPSTFFPVVIVDRDDRRRIRHWLSPLLLTVAVADCS